jgi:acetyl esterase/lipase
MKGKEIVKMIFMVFFCCFVIGCVSINWTLEDIPYGEETLQSVNIIMPKDPNNVHAIIYIHGGFYFSGNKLWYPLFLTEFAEKNIFASINYRLISGKENTVNIDEMLSDVNNALIKIKNTAEENGITIKDFILAGHSSGGHLALLYAYKYLKENNIDAIKIAACVSLAGPADYRDDFGWSSMSMYGNTVEQRLKTMSWIGTELTGYSMELTQYDWNNQNNYAEYLPYKISLQ